MSKSKRKGAGKFRFPLPKKPPKVIQPDTEYKRKPKHKKLLIEQADDEEPLRP